MAFENETEKNNKPYGKKKWYKWNRILVDFGKYNMFDSFKKVINYSRNISDYGSLFMIFVTHIFLQNEIKAQGLVSPVLSGIDDLAHFFFDSQQLVVFAKSL